MNINKLSELLKSSGKTKSQIASDSGITRVTLDNALSGGDIRVSVLEAIASALGVSAGVFFAPTEKTSPACSAHHNIQSTITQASTIHNAPATTDKDIEIERLKAQLKEKDAFIDKLLYAMNNISKL